MGQSPPPTVDPSARPASLNRTAPRAQQSVRFARRPAQVGDRVEQTVSRVMRLTTSWRQGDKIVETSTRTMRGHKQRHVTTTRTDKGSSQAVLVRYGDATKRVAPGASPQAESPQNAPPPAETATVTNEPVALKTYRCWREGEKLIVTDEAGHTPPPAEVEIVAADMEAVGRPNPFADFLAGRTVAVGEKLALPLDVAERLFGFGDRFGQLTRFDLTLREIRTEDGAACAVFQVSLEAASHDASQMRLLVDGPLVVQIGTCRAVRSHLTGPLAMSESRQSYGVAYQLISTGKISMSISSSYRDPQLR
ncbi:MAG: hypothetical protein WD669_07335 [Pirellulales bacterium]